MKITCVYAPVNFHDRQLLWRALSQLSHINNLPWLCVGDFNDILYYWEKEGKRSADSLCMHYFREMLHDCKLMDLKSKGCAFTWMNNRQGGDLVKERLDRALCTLDWHLIFPAAEVFVLPAIGSDHSSLVLSTEAKRPRSSKPFVFEAYWLHHLDYRNIVTAAWALAKCDSINLPHKIRLVSAALSRWSRTEFSNAQSHIADLQQQLQALTNHSQDRYDFQKAFKLKADLQRAWQQEEQYWAMWSRLQWLKWGDQNTRFFHATTIQRQQRNKISLLQDHQQQWVSDEAALKDMTLEFFFNLYRTTGYRNYDPILNQCLTHSETMLVHCYTGDE